MAVMAVPTVTAGTILASRITRPIRSYSALMCTANASGVVPPGITASLIKRSLMSLDLTAATISLFKRSLMARGVCAGATMPYHDPASNPGSPASATVGTLASAAERVAPVMAIARSLPLLACGNMATALENIKGT